MDTEYKELHEKFVVNVEGTSPLEVLAFTCLNHFAHFLLLTLISLYPCEFPARGLKRAALEGLVLFGPFVLSVTVLSDIDWISSVNLITGLTIFVGSLIALTIKRSAISQLQWTEILFIPKKSRDWKMSIFTNVHVNLIVAVVVSILAVDFKVFPRRFAKTETFGWSLMDVGVAGFIAINGLVSPEARRGSTLNSSRSNSIISTIKSTIPLLILGFQRLIAVKSTNYHEHVAEYGVHWNFFFTLALTKIASTVHSVHFVSKARHGLFAIGLLVAHQFALSLGLSSFIQSDTRSNLFSANKEGILSLPGYVALYLVFVEMGAYIFANRNRGKNVDYLMLTVEMWFVAICSTVLMSFAHHAIEPVSRREVNAAYVLWIVALVSFVLGLESLLQLVVECLRFMGFLNRSAKSVLIAAIEYNSLLIFLVANVLTGLFNFAFRTHSTSAPTAMIILFSYSLALALLAEYFFRIRLKAMQVPVFFINKMRRKFHF